MKYTRILCWVRPHEKKELKKDFQRIKPVFIKNCNELGKKIKDGDYIVLSAMEANSNIEKLQNIICTFHQNTFILYNNRLKNEDLPENVGILWGYENVIDGLYLASDIINNYLGIIPNLTEHTQKNFHIEFGLEDGSPGARLVHN